MRVALLSLGCKVNQAEMTELERSLRRMGHGVVSSLDEHPEVCIINTCTVTSKSDYQSRQLIRRAGRTGSRVFVTGCYAHMNRELLDSMEEVDAVISNDDKSSIINLLPNDIKSSASDITSAGSSRTRLFLKVQDGCDYSCSYCLISKARGQSRSLQEVEVLRKVQEAIQDGYKEITLTGVHLGHYGLDLEPRSSLSELIEQILTKSDIYRIRLGSLQPDEIEERLIELLGDRRVCRHLHIPLQSGDDRILRLMRRSYDVKTYSKAVETLAARIDGISIGADIITGFPGEDDESFQRTYGLAEELPLSYMHVFPYSPRKGTEAQSMKGRASDAQVKARASVLREIASKKKSEFLHRNVGEVLEVLMEQRDASGHWRGTSDNYLKVRTARGGFVKGDIVPVSVQGVEDGLLYGDSAI